MTTHSLTYFAIALGLLGGLAYADNFPFAQGTFDANNKLTEWTLEKARKYRDETIGNLKNDDGSEKSVPQKDAAADPNKLKGYPSHDVETKSFTTDIDLTDVSGLVYVAIHVDDIANLTATEIDDAGEPIGTPIHYNVKGSALWRAEKSYKEFPNPLLGGKKYRLNLDYTNTVNLTKQYNGPIDYDGVNVFLMYHPAVDLDVDSDNTEGFEITWGDDKEDKIEASATEPGKIIAVPIEPDADNDNIPDYMDFGGISSDPKKQFVQMVVHLPPNYDPETTTVTFGYPMSETTDSSSTQPPNSGFRIWTRNGDAPRSLNAIPAAQDPASGYLVKNGDPILWRNLATQCNLNPTKVKDGVYPGPALILYLETVITYTGGRLSKLQPEQIKVNAKNGSSSDGLETQDLVNISVRCTGGVKITGPKAIMVNDNHHNRDASGNQIDQWDYTNDRTGTLDPDVLPIAIEVIALDQDVWVTLSSEAMKGIGEAGTPATGGLIDGVFPGYTEPQGEDEITDEEGQSKIGWKSVPYTLEVKKNTTFRQNLYIEGQRHSATVDDVVIKLETTGKDIKAGDPKPCISTTDSEHKMTVYQVDLDVDSDNDSILSNTEAEDQIEASKTLPGKVLVSSISPDANGDGIVDYKNGVDGQPLIKGAKFTPMRLILPEPFDPVSTEIAFNYDEALPPLSGIRIWCADASTPRTIAKSLISRDSPITWSDLQKKTGMNERHITLYVEGINTLGTSFESEQEITVTAKQQGGIKTSDTVNFLFLSFEVEEVISDQIAGNEANKLPTDYYGEHPNNPMLMATRKGTDARLMVKMNLPASHATSIIVGVRKTEESTILNSATALLPPIKTPLSFVAYNGTQLYEVVAGYDSNGNSILDSYEATIVFRKTPKTDPKGGPYSGGDTTYTYLDKILIVSKEDYDTARRFTQSYDLALEVSHKNGSDLMGVFSTGATQIPKVTTTVWGRLLDANDIPSSQGLSHPLGANWNTNNQANTFELKFPKFSTLAGKLQASSGLAALRDRIIKDNVSSLLGSATPTEQISAPIPFIDDKISFQNSDPLSDLHLALGKCGAKGTLTVQYRKTAAGNLEITKYKFDGHVFDLYDWAYGTKLVLPILGQIDLTKDAAKTQAGHATLTNSKAKKAGRVFFTQVNFKNNWENLGNIY